MRIKRGKDLTPWRDLVTERVRGIRLLEPVPGKDFPVCQDALIIGGGLAGIETAQKLAELGIRVFLVEKNQELGGRLKQIPAVYGLEKEPLGFIAERIERIKSNPLIKIITSAQVTELKGQVGNFQVSVQQNGEKILITVGAIVVATGYAVAKGYDQFKVQPSDNIISQSELENRLNPKGKTRKEVFSVGDKVPGIITFLLGVCSKVSKLPTLSALTCGLVLKKRLDAEIYVLHDGIRVAGSGLEALYRTARKERGGVFTLY